MRPPALLLLLASVPALAQSASSISRESAQSTPFNAVSATATATSSPDLVNSFQNYALAISYSAGITGTPQSCEIQPQTSVDGTTFFSYGNPIPIAPAVSASAWLPPNGHPGPMGAQFKYVYTCDTYPSAGTFTLKTFYSGRDSTQATTNDTVVTEALSSSGTVSILLNGAQGASFTVSVLSGSGSTIVLNPQIVDPVSGTAQTIPVFDFSQSLFVTAPNVIPGNYQFPYLGGVGQIQVVVTIIGGSSVVQIALRATTVPYAFPIQTGAPDRGSGVGAGIAGLGGVVETMPVSFSTQPFLNIGATVTRTSVADTLGAWAGVQLYVNWLGVTGAPSGCTIQPQIDPDGLNFQAFGPPITVMPGTAALFSVPAPTQIAQQMRYVYACGTYPTGGSLTLNANYTNTPFNTATNPIDGQKVTYHAAKVSGTLVTGATDFCYITGSASKTVRVTRIAFAGSATTGVAVPFVVLKRSTANTAGTCATTTAVPLDSTDAAATAVATYCTVNPTTGTLVGNIEAQTYFLAATATAPSSPLVFTFGTLPGERALVLRGTSQVAALNANATAISGGLADCTIDWTEE